MQEPTKAKAASSEATKNILHYHYCCHCNRYWKHTEVTDTCADIGTIFGPWWVAKACVSCLGNLRRRAHTIKLFERIAWNTKESISGARR